MNGAEVLSGSSAKRRFGQEEDDDMDTDFVPRAGPVQVSAEEDAGFVNPFQTAKATLCHARLYTQVDPEEEEEEEQRKRVAPSSGRFQLPVEIVGQLLEAINDAGVSSMSSDNNLGNLALVCASRRQQFFSYLAKLNQDGGLEKVLYDLTKERLKASPLRSLDQARLHRVAAITILLTSGVRPSHIDMDSDKTPLHWAAFHGYETLVSDMIKHGAYVDAKDKQGITPLRYAQLNNKISVCAILGLVDKRV